MQLDLLTQVGRNAKKGFADADIKVRHASYLPAQQAFSPFTAYCHYESRLSITTAARGEQIQAR
jgi:hypothetical protein